MGSRSWNYQKRRPLKFWFVANLYIHVYKRSQLPIPAPMHRNQKIPSYSSAPKYKLSRAQFRQLARKHMETSSLAKRNAKHLIFLAFPKALDLNISMLLWMARAQLPLVCVRKDDFHNASPVFAVLRHLCWNMLKSEHTVCYSRCRDDHMHAAHSTIVTVALDVVQRPFISCSLLAIFPWPDHPH